LGLVELVGGMAATLGEVMKLSKVRFFKEL